MFWVINGLLLEYINLLVLPDSYIAMYLSTKVGIIANAIYYA